MSALRPSNLPKGAHRTEWGRETMKKAAPVGGLPARSLRT